MVYNDFAMQDEHFMEEALKEARKAFDENEVPVGAVVVLNDAIIGRGHNKREGLLDISSHAEIEALKDAARTIGSWKMEGCTLYVTLEPCLMCSGAILQSKLSRIVYGPKDIKDGGIVSKYYVFDTPCEHERPLINSGVLEEECAAILKDFFVGKRKI